jgi:hypothetical protein
MSEVDDDEGDDDIKACPNFCLSAVTVVSYLSARVNGSRTACLPPMVLKPLGVRPNAREEEDEFLHHLVSGKNSDSFFSLLLVAALLVSVVVLPLLLL